MSDLLLDIGTDRILLAEIKGNDISAPIEFSRTADHPMLWISSALQAWPGEIETVVAASTGAVSGGRIFSRDLGNIDFVDLVASQFQAPALLLQSGQAAALAGTLESDDSLLAVHFGETMTLGFWDEELLRGASGLAGEVPGAFGRDKIEEMYRERSGKMLVAEKIFGTARSGETIALDVVQEFSSEAAEDLRGAIYLLDPRSVIFSGGRFWSDLEPWLLPALRGALAGEGSLREELLASREICTSRFSEYAPLLGAATLSTAHPDVSNLLS